MTAWLDRQRSLSRESHSELPMETIAANSESGPIQAPPDPDFLTYFCPMIE